MIRLWRLKCCRGHGSEFSSVRRPLQGEFLQLVAQFQGIRGFRSTSDTGMFLGRERLDLCQCRRRCRSRRRRGRGLADWVMPLLASVTIRTGGDRRSLGRSGGCRGFRRTRSLQRLHRAGDGMLPLWLALGETPAASATRSVQLRNELDEATVRGTITVLTQGSQAHAGRVGTRQDGSKRPMPTRNTQRLDPCGTAVSAREHDYRADRTREGGFRVGCDTTSRGRSPL